MGYSNGRSWVDARPFIIPIAELSCSIIAMQDYY